MKHATRPMSDLILALAPPMVWAAHFFGVYLTEALLCTTKGEAAHGSVLLTGILLTAVAIGLLLGSHARLRAFGKNLHGALKFAGPLALLSLLAVVWTSLPLFLLSACTPRSW
jgi:hypothetical protein